ncbi:MAG: HTTM domain-containing protein [Flavobacteriales bacterium]|jgi:vitamin K-dependent gamma-carboxylase|nr:HTTM domain-containing protein [Flavobacteriales bacterium]MBK6752340.1 HTTM domain-containing protein [Flavobacteriales bacterium]MBK7268896.1 HTTM domain-containing protein [Flavobacteriales bacterium]MBK9074312.1 HTTM domain-containing protein [Flavobacteriales bacterium]
MSRSLSQWWEHLHAHTDARALAVFRMLVGGLFFYEIGFYLNINLVDMGLVGPKLLFPYEGLEWIRPMGKGSMDFILGGLGIAALMIAAGLLYRFAIAYFLVAYLYILLLDRANFNNHFYLFVLVSFLLCLSPANRAWSIDRLLFKKRMRVEGAPRWCWLILRAQIVIVYFYGGIAKLNADWLGRMEPMRSALDAAARGNAMEDFLTSTPILWLFTYGGVLFDLFIGPLLWWKRTRMYALPLVIFFNVANHFLFDDIGVFPFFMMAATILFFDPEEIARFFGDKKDAGRGRKQETPTVEDRRWRPLVTSVLAVYLAFQLLFPLRWVLLPGDVDWSTIGQRFSWRMKISTRNPQQIAFFVRDDDAGIKRPIELTRFINNVQTGLTAYDPRATIRFARWMKEEMHRRGMKKVRVTSETIISHNGRPFRYYFAPEEDLSVIDPDLAHPERWVPPAEAGPEHAVDPKVLFEIERRKTVPPPRQQRR